MRTPRRVATAVALLITLAACGGTDSTDASDRSAAADDTTTCALGQTDGDLLFYNWTDYIDPGLIDQFEEEFAVRVVQDYFPSNEEMLARVVAGGARFDIVVPSDYMVEIMIADDLLLPLQTDVIPNRANIDDDFIDPPYDPGLVFSVPYLWGTTGLGYNAALLGEVEESWSLVFDPEIAGALPGRILLLDDARETLGAALQYLGFSPNTTDEEELQAAADVIATAKAWTQVYNSDLYAELLIAGEVVVSLGYSGNFLDAFDGDERFDYFIPQEGATIWTDNLVVLADAPSPCTAQTFIDFMLRAESAAALTDYLSYATPNTPGEALIDPEILADPRIYPTEETMQRLRFLEDTGDFETRYTDLFGRARN